MLTISGYTLFFVDQCILNENIAGNTDFIIIKFNY